MHFLTNGPAKKRSVRRRKAKRATVARRRVRRTRRQTQKSGGKTMATRRRRRRSTARRAAPRRRRRRRSVLVLRANPRRRRRSVRRRVHHRRRYRRNPGGSGIVATIKQGVVDGALVLVGQAAQGRASSLVSRVVPIGGLPGAAIADVGSAVVITMLARKFLPGRARMVSAGAFSNAVRRIVSTVSPTAAALLGDGDDYTAFPVGTDLYEAQGGVSAYPAMGAYPGGGLGDAAEDLSGYVIG